jgi:hypothetical protein
MNQSFQEQDVDCRLSTADQNVYSIEYYKLKYAINILARQLFIVRLLQVQIKRNQKDESP